METKRCPSCCEEINLDAKRCPRCQTDQQLYIRIIRHPVTGTLVSVSIALLFLSWFFNTRLSNNAIYDPGLLLSLSNTKLTFYGNSCGKKLSVIGTITNSGEDPLTDIVFDAEFYDENGSLIDVVSDTLLDLVIPAGASKSFRINDWSGANENLYASHAVKISKAERDIW